MSRILKCLAVFWLLTHSAYAQETGLAGDLADQDDKGFLTTLLEESLGGEGRIVRIDGFQGALSRSATITQITIADELGIWLTLSDLQLVWNRGALLRGRIEIEELSAAKLALARLPQQPESDLPAAEASGFSLPKLPVSVQIDALNIGRIELADPVLGAEAVMTLAANAILADGSGEVALTASRIDGERGRFVIDARYEAGTERVMLNLDLTEAEDGIVARALDLPGRPDLRLQVTGEGSLNDLVTDIALETEGVKRLAGQVVLNSPTGEDRNFSFDLNGDLSPLIPPEYRAFFGNETALKAKGTRSSTGAIELSNLDLKTGAVTLQGALSLNAKNWPTRIAVDGQITADGNRIILPLGEGDTSLSNATLAIDYDSAQSENLSADIVVTDLATPTATAQRLNLTVNGALEDTLAAQNSVQADVAFGASDLAFTDPDLQQTVGEQIKGTLQLEYEAEGDLKLDQIDVVGADYGFAGNLTITGLADEFETKINANLRADQLARFSGLTGADLKGSAVLAITGTADLGGSFDLLFDGTTTDLGLGIAQADAALSGLTQLTLAAIRDETGTRLPSLSLSNDQLKLTGSATLKTDASDAQFDLTLIDSAKIDPRLKGAVTLSGDAVQDTEGWSVDATANGPFDATTTLIGRVAGANPSLKFDANIPDINPVLPQYRGAAGLKGTAKQVDGAWIIDTDLVGPYGISGSAAGTLTGAAPNLRYTLNVPDVAPLGAQISGALALNGTAAQKGEAWQVITFLSGLSGTRAQLSGDIRTNGQLDLKATGTAPLALANPFLAPRNLQGQARFDLSVRGRPALSSLSGTITTENSRLSAPNLRVALNDITARTALSRGRAQVDLSAALSSGGRITLNGPITLTPSLPADLSLTLNSVRLVDPQLYQTILDGQLSLRGPLAGGALIAGQINVGETNIQVPSTQSASFAIIPQISHVNARPAVRTTLSRAGLGAKSQRDATGSNGPSIGLNITINAPSRIFVRGRGLDAELGGALTLRGRTDQLISQGRFNLVRGRLDILGKRFQLDEGSILLQGQLDPFLRFVATTTTTVGTASVIIEGPASDPNVRFTSSPEAPQDEVLAQIFFGRDASQLSAFQALQLASAVATLAGQGGEGIVSKLRRGFDLDDLDVTTDAQGNTGLRIGKYISDNVYTDVTIGDTSTAGISVNIDLTPNLTARGQVKSDGDTSIGVFFEKDY